MSKTPEDFRKIHPFDSAVQKTECEIVARNIMSILSRTGNTFRKLDYDEYVSERLEDGNFSPVEARYFDDVIGYCKSADTAELFSSAWR